MVNPVLNNFIDMVTGREVRLEPRLMHVLCLLAANVNQLVSREILIKAVWNNYGGADEGLTQAISFLRKLLEDRDKKVIETIPTRGYLLRATITAAIMEKEKEADETASIKSKSNRKLYWITGLILVAILAALSLFLWPSEDDGIVAPYPVPRAKPLPAIKTTIKLKMKVKPKRNLPPLETLKH